jgi:hypothetical protein
MNRIRIWPHATLIVLLAVAIAAGAAVLWKKYERTAEAKALPNAARIERVEGQVGLNRSLDKAANGQWVEATANTPISLGDRIYTRDNGQTEIAFTGRNFAMIDANTSLDVLDLSNQHTQVALREGSALFDVGSLASSELFEVATPCGAVDLERPGVYQIAIENNGNASATALSGQAQLVGQSGSGVIEKGETLSVPCRGGSGVLSRVDANQAGTLLDNYYRHRYPRNYDGRYRNYYTYLDDPYYYDPYRSYPSYNYVTDYIPGVEDLDYYGNWQYLSDYGYGWRPSVNSGWAPYQSGSWMMDYPFGLTWVSSEPWGYAPYHYGRWAYVGNQWFWIPDSVNTSPVYSPALVAFLPLSQSTAAWVALGPGDPYAPMYYDPNWDPVYLTPTNVIQERIVNISVPGAVTVVPTQNFIGVIDPSVIIPVDPPALATVRPVLDPLTVDPLRRVAFQTREARRTIGVPQSIAQLVNTPVVTTSDPVAPPFRRDLARALRVESVPDKVRNQKLQFKDERTTETAQQTQTTSGANTTTEQARERQMADLAREAGRGNRAARQEMQELHRQQLEQQRAERVATQQAQGERVRQQMQTQQAQREAARQQMITTQQQRHAAIQQRIESQRAQQAVRHSQQQQQVKPQTTPQRREPKPQAQYHPPQAQQRVSAPARPQQIRQPAAPKAAPEAVRQPRQAQPRAQPPAEGQKKPVAQPQPPAQKKKPPEGAA